MNHPTLKLIAERTSINRFDPTHVIDDATIVELVRYASEAPSAYNFQNWRFIAVRTSAQKARLCAMAYGQKKVEEASVTFIVCGRMNPHLQLREAWRPFVTAGHADAATVDAAVDSATRGYADNTQAQRDEAIRSASLAAMTLMLAAQAMGLVSGPMIGFDPDQVRTGFDLSPDDIPAMLVTVGRPAAGNWPRKLRLPVSAVLSIV